MWPSRGLLDQAYVKRMSTLVAHTVQTRHLNLQGILVARHILLTSCNTISPQGLYAHPLLISYLFRDITYHLDTHHPMLSASQPHGSGINSLSAFAKPSHFLLLKAILRLTFSSQLTPPPNDPPSNAP